MIELINVSKTFNHKDFVIKNLSLEIAHGETLVLLGGSGSGKTTTLQLINRLVEPTLGQILINGRDITTLDTLSLRRKMGFVFQDVGLFPHMTVAENITIVLRLMGVNSEERHCIARKLLNDINLDPDIFCKRFPSQLSGGQQQRVGVARALSMEPDLLLMDEPFGALDAVNRHMLQNELLSIKQQLNKTIIFVTHDIFEALRLGDRIAVMNDGHLEQVGSKKEIVTRPATQFVRELFGRAITHLQDFMSLLDE
jgi:osmoprotectant transport system ATP-binding protein